VSAEVAERAPRVVTLHVRPAGAGRAAAVAVVGDGRLIYPVAFELVRQDRRWLVSALVPR
jgi:hypothetical protein